jgi:GNAT superfamily N-acetyltransferase
MLVRTRPAIPSDTEPVAELYIRARRAAATTGAIPPLAHVDDEVRRWIADQVVPKLECWIACSSSALLGMLVINREWIEQLYVDPDLTGHGVGAELVAVAKRERPTGLRLWTFASNERAQRFYLQHNFREVQRTDGSGNEEHAPDIQYAWHPDPVRLPS